MTPTDELRRDRREILHAAGVAALLAAVSSALGGCAASDGEQGDATTDPGPAIDLRSAWTRARALGKPLLVIVIPEDPMEHREREHLFGALLNHGGDELLADLALCELACARRSEIPDATGAAHLEGEPLLVLVESQERPPRAIPIAPPIPPKPSGLSGRVPSDRWDLAEETTRKRMEILSQTIRDAVVGDAVLLERRACEAAQHLPSATKSELEGILHRGKTPPLADVERAAAMVRRAAEAAVATRPTRIAVLAQVSAARWLRTSPPGARWAYSTGCGTTIEGEEEEGLAYPCGIGYAPQLSQRFLYFYRQG